MDISTKLWARWAHEELINRETYPWEEVTMKVFHLNDPDFKIPPKGNCETHHKSTSKYWSHIVTNKAKRTDGDFALLFDPNGKKIHKISHATFKLLIRDVPNHDHIYLVYPLSNADFEDEVIPLLPRLNRYQIDALLYKLIHSNLHVDAHGYHRGDNCIHLTLGE